MKTTSISFKTAQVNGIKVFYREAGDPQAPAVLLLHGFPTSSHMFRNLIPELAGKITSLPRSSGFRFSDAPDHKTFPYTFDHLAKVIGDFMEQVDLKIRGLRLRLRRSRRVPSRISLSRAHYGPDFSKRERL